MDIIKVIVRGELPGNCGDCDLLTEHGWGHDYCILNNRIDVEYDKRPEECPLVSTDDLTVSDDGWGWIVEMPDSD